MKGLEEHIMGLPLSDFCKLSTLFILVSEHSDYSDIQNHPKYIEKDEFYTRIQVNKDCYF